MRSTALGILLPLVLTILLAGCGGGGSSGSGAEDGGSGGGSGTSSNGDQEQQTGSEGGGGENGEGAAGESKIALGRIVGVNGQAGRFSVEPSTEEQGQEPITFKLAEGGVVTLDGEEVELSAMEEGQAAQVEYVVLGELNRARTVELLAGEATTG